MYHLREAAKKAKEHLLLLSILDVHQVQWPEAF